MEKFEECKNTNFEFSLKQWIFIKRVLKKKRQWSRDLDFENLYTLHLLSFCVSGYAKRFEGDWIKCNAALEKDSGEIGRLKKEFENAFAEDFAERQRLVEGLPKEILDTVEDRRFFCLGYCTEKTIKILRKYKDMRKGIKRLRKSVEQKNDVALKCKNFPDGFPSGIFYGVYKVSSSHLAGLFSMYFHISS